MHDGQGWPLDISIYERYLSLRINAPKYHKIVWAYNVRRSVQQLLDDPTVTPHEVEII